MTAPPRARTRSLLAACALAGAVLAAWGAGALRAHGDPSTAWLEAQPDCEWIVFPVPAGASVHRLVELTAIFRKRVTIEGAGAPLSLTVRAFRKASLAVNGAPVPLEGGDESWKRPRRADLAGVIRPGENLLEVAVANAVGPPALCLALSRGGAITGTDASWEASIAGSAWRPAGLARAPAPGRGYDPARASRPALASLAERWRLLAAFALGSAALAAGWLRPGASGGTRRWVLPAALAAIALLWGALFVNDAVDALPLRSGFDGEAHLDYVRYLLRRHAIPLADEGWQTFQPPLYYLVVAAVHAVAGIEVGGSGSLAAVRGIGLAIGLAHVAVVAALLRRLFPGRPLPLAVGLLLAAFVPPMLYLHQFPTNEILGAALSSAVVLATLALVQRPPGSARPYLALGALLGLALLAKFSTLLLVPVVIGALGLRALDAPGTRAQRAARVAAVPAAAIAVSAWHFGRVWARFGDPFVGGWEARPGLGWWVAPGYRTAEHFARFGRVLVDPLYAGIDGFWDGLYSTAWGDGLLSGLVRAALPPWWSPSLHAAAIGLALIPTVLLLAGGAAAAVRFVRAPEAAGALLAGLPLLVLLALALMTVRVPSVAQDKAFYGLVALAPIAALAGLGAERLAAGRRGVAASLVAAMGVWAATSYSAYLVDRRSPDVRITGAVMRVSAGDEAGGIRALRSAVEETPSHWGTRIALARVLTDSGQGGAEVEALLAPAAPEPDVPERHLAIALWALDRRDLAAAFGAARRTVELAPDSAEAWAALAEVLAAAGRAGEAVGAWREVLRIEPHDAQAHGALAALHAGAGRRQAAAFHAALAARLSGR